MGRSNPSAGEGKGEAETAAPVEGTLPSAGDDSPVHIGTAPTLPPPPETDATLDRYVLVRELGRGGMGRVDEVFDSTLGRAVARKASLVVASDVRAKMLVAEAQTCAQLEHPSIVPVYDAGIDVYGQPFYTMRSVRGRTLAQVLEENASGGPDAKPLAQVLGIFRQVCLAADYAHSRGVVHRDLKPDNVIVGEFGEVYILDWGIAQVMAGSDVRRAELEKFAAGSPGYIAPEQALGVDVDARADVFSLGAILHEILTGEVPFDDTDFLSVRARATSRLSMVPSQRASSVATSFDELVGACLEPSPADRLASARLIADAIDVYLDRERDKAERELDAERHCFEGRVATEAFVSLERESRRLDEQAKAELAAIPRWHVAEEKERGWEGLARARALAAEAAHSLARAEVAFGRALARVDGHLAARAGLARLHLRQFEAAEAAGDTERMVQHLDLARTFDDGDLALELADSGELCIECGAEGVEISVSRYEQRGVRLVLGPGNVIHDGETVLMASGSYVVTVAVGGREVRYPIRMRRALRHRIHAVPRSVPSGLAVVPGGPFLATDGHERRSDDFAIGVFPVTLAEYSAFLDELAPEEQARRTPRASTSEAAGIVKGPRGWRLADGEIEGPARDRIAGRELELPVADISYFDALAYVEWLARKTGLPYRLPTDLEWDKAMRGADGRAFPMGDHIDPAFAKLRESRPEASQPEPVGAFPLDESPYGVRDMAGGVGDWTQTMADGGAPPTLAEEGTSAGEREGVWRGGAWSTTAAQHAPMRYTQMLRHRVGWVGFRVALTLDGPGSDLVVEPMRRT